MGKIILTVRMGNKNIALWNICNKTQRIYADRVGADFEIITPVFIAPTNSFKHYAYTQTIQAIDYLDKYDQVLYLDSDVLISPNAPNIFEVYPDFDIFRACRMVGEEYKATKAYQDKYKIAWSKKDDKEIYYNTAVMLMGKDCRMEYDNTEYLTAAGHDETFYSFILQKNKVKNEDIGEKFNKMFVHRTIPRRECYFIHYGGQGFTGLTGKEFYLENENRKAALAQEDLEYFYGVNHV